MAEKRQHWTVIALLKWTADYLAEKKMVNARLNAERLLSHVLGCRRVDLYVNFERPLSADELVLFKALLKRRLSREPLQYIIGETEFFSLSFNVGPGVLIPRPETELLVEKVIDYGRSMPACRILDIGTGSGCIAISLARHLEHARITAIDNSEQALDRARENAEKNHVLDRIQFLIWDFFTDQVPFPQLFDIVAANPPYIRQSDYNELPPEIKNFEPDYALLAGPDGLDAYRALQSRLPGLLQPDGKAFFEIGADQAQDMRRIFPNVVIVQDLAGRDRLAVIARIGESDAPTVSGQA